MRRDAGRGEMESRGRLDLPGVDGDEGPARTQPNLPERVAFTLHALWRRKGLAAFLFFGGVAASYLYLSLRTPTYHVETKILAQKQQPLPSVVRPIEDVPTRSASDLIHRRENLITLIKKTGLYVGGERARPPWYRRLPQLGFLGPRSAPDDDPLSGLVLRLDKALVVTTGEGTITIEIDWPSPQQAYGLVEAALQNFLEARHAQEITTVEEVVAQLQARATTLRKELDEVIQEVQRAPARDTSSSRATTSGSRAARRAQGEEVARLRSQLEGKQRAIRDMEDFQRKRLADLQAQLEEKRGIYSDAYPGVVSLQQDIDALSQESPKVASMREEEAKLRADYSARLGKEPLQEQGASSAPAPVASRREREGSPEQEERLRDARFSYQQMIERINSAQLELDAARAAYKYRYAVIWPAQLPKKPVSPKPQKVLGLGTLASFLLAVFAATMAEVRAGRVVERWQVERTLGLAVLAELSRK